MIRIVAAGALLALTAIVGSNAAAGKPPTADLTIVNVGTTAGYLTLNLNPGAFTLADGESRRFQNLDPGRYVVVQAPPVGVVTQIGPNEYSVEGGMSISCTNGEAQEVNLSAGDDVTCTFTFAPI